jgi:chromosome segregation ATPase
MATKEKCEKCAEMKKELGAAKVKLEIAEKACEKNKKSFESLAAELDNARSAIQRQATEIANGKNRSAELVKARNESIANRDDVLAELAQAQAEVRQLKNELTEAKRELSERSS